MTERVTKTSTCLCGSVSLSLTGEDKGACMCHCKNCQLSSGSSFAHNYRLSNGDLKIIKGEDLVREYADQDTKSGNTLLRHFCGKCGSPLYINTPEGSFYALTAGTMQTQAAPQVEYFVENKHPWLTATGTSASPSL
ncbi:hypothetical protein KC330_g4496 [Hortaea werneckii]|nr:hypothetical protein KC330_g4496 [Hortaea werneckii]